MPLHCEQSRRLLWGKRRSAAGGGCSEALSVQRSKKSSSTRCDDFFADRKPAAKPRMPGVRVSPLGPRSRRPLMRCPTSFLTGDSKFCRGSPVDCCADSAYVVGHFYFRSVGTKMQASLPTRTISLWNHGWGYISQNLLPAATDFHH